MGVEKIEGCIGCGTCVLTCPMDVFRLKKKGEKVEARYAQDCQVCRLCLQYCPVGAITLSEDRTIPAVTAWG